MRHTLRKSEIVRGRNNFQRIFDRGKKFEGNILSCFVLSSPSIEVQGESIVKAGFALKRIFRRSVDRNRVKRLMRESYRLNKEIILNQVKGGSKNLTMIFLYSPPKRTSADLPSFADIANDMKLVLRSISQAGFQ